MKEMDLKDIVKNCPEESVSSDALTNSITTSGAIVTGNICITGTNSTITSCNTNNITIGTTNTSLVYSGSGGYALEVPMHLDLKSLIVNKKIKLKSLEKNGIYEFFDIKKIKLKRKGTELQCEKRINTLEIDDIKSKKVLLNEIIDTHSIEGVKKAAINFSEIKIGYNSFGITYDGTTLNNQIITNSITYANDGIVYRYGGQSTLISHSDINLVSGTGAVINSYC